MGTDLKRKLMKSVEGKKPGIDVVSALKMTADENMSLLIEMTIMTWGDASAISA